MDGLTTGGMIMAGIGLTSGILGKIVFDWLKGGKRNGNGNGKQPADCRNAQTRIEKSIDQVQKKQEVQHDREIESAVILRQINENIKEQTKIQQNTNTLLQVITGGGGGRHSRVLGD